MISSRRFQHHHQNVKKTWFKNKSTHHMPAPKSKSMILCAIFLIVCYSITVDTDIERRAHQLLARKEERRLITEDKGGGACNIGSPVEDAPNVPSLESTRTLLTSYPGSGKRFTWAGEIRVYCLVDLNSSHIQNNFK